MLTAQNAAMNLPLIWSIEMKRSYYNPDTHRAVPIEPDESMIATAMLPLKATQLLPMQPFTVETKIACFKETWARVLAAAPEVPAGDGKPTLAPHVYREFVNELKRAAETYHGMQQLRERIAHIVAEYVGTPAGKESV